MNSHWLERYRAGDPLAVERLVCTYQQDVYRLALSILDDSHDAEDATQEAFLAALRALDSFQGTASFKTWLYAIAVNLCRTRLQRRKSRERLQTILQAILPLRTCTDSPEETTLQREADSALWRAVHKLDDKHRLPILLRYYHDLSVAEIAEILKIPQGTVHSCLNTARACLRDVLKEGQT
jgi:RNA polymerase sigma-70 factor, ECF subfamily